MFMRDLPISGLPEFDLINGKDLQSAHRKLLTIKEALKARFRKEYLANLVTRGGKGSKINPAVGQVVLVGSDNTKRFEWPLGRIVELLPGRDGGIRLCKVKTNHRVMLRPIQRLYPLEVRPQEMLQGVPEERSKDVHSKAKENLKADEGGSKRGISKSTKNRTGPILTTKSGRRVKTPYYSVWK